MKTKAVESAATETEKLLAGQAAEIASLEAKVEEETQAIQNASDAMNRASDDQNVQAYQAAKNEYRNASDAKEMFETRLEKLTNQPLIDADKYASMKEAITREMDANTVAAIKKLKDLTDQIKDTGDALRKSGMEANRVLAQIQSELYNNQDRQRSRDGKYWLGNTAEYRNKDYFDALGWVDTAADVYMYKQMCRKEDD